VSIETLANQSVEIQRATVTRDAIGGKTETWNTVQTVNARVQPLSGAENVKYGRDVEVRMVKMYIPSAPTITHANRIRFNSDNYQVLSVHNIDHLNHHLRVVCELQK
jgi:SPP1 family predicted phage head-tail adaptor